MKKEDILKKYKEEGTDEGKEHTNKYGDDYGFYALCGLSMLLMIYKIWSNQPYGDIASLLFIFLSVGSFYRYKKEKNRSFIYFGTVTGVLCLAFLVWYIWETIGR